MMMNLNANVPVAPQLDSGMTLLIDADYWTYQLAAVLQSKNFNPEVDTESAQLSDGTIVHVESEDALYTLVDATIRDLMRKFRTDKIEVYLQGTDNFREDVAVSKPYKGTRSKIKPFYYQECRDYLKSNHGAVVIDGKETDDQVATRQCELNIAGQLSCIVTVDKDLRMVPGLLYNPQKNTLTFSHPYDCKRAFWRQMITGDKVDNIPGIFRRGDKWADQIMDERDYETLIVDEYDIKHDVHYLHEQATLLWMQRRDSEIWSLDYDWTYGMPANMVAIDDYMDKYEEWEEAE